MYIAIEVCIKRWQNTLVLNLQYFTNKIISNLKQLIKLTQNRSKQNIAHFQ